MSHPVEWVRAVGGRWVMKSFSGGEKHIQSWEILQDDVMVGAMTGIYAKTMETVVSGGYIARM